MPLLQALRSVFAYLVCQIKPTWRLFAKVLYLFYCHLSGEEPVPKNQDNIVGVVAGILGALILIVIIIIAVLLYKR